MGNCSFGASGGSCWLGGCLLAGFRQSITAIISNTIPRNTTVGMSVAPPNARIVPMSWLAGAVMRGTG